MNSRNNNTECANRDCERQATEQVKYIDPPEKVKYCIQCATDAMNSSSKATRTKTII